MKENLYIVTYDIRDTKRWRQVYRVMKGYGAWVQLSVFQCRLSKRRRATLKSKLDELIHHGQDHILFMDMGPADSVRPQVESLGYTKFERLLRKTTIV